jgi:hypothetical protein
VTTADKSVLQAQLRTFFSKLTINLGDRNIKQRRMEEKSLLKGIEFLDFDIRFLMN